MLQILGAILVIFSSTALGIAGKQKLSKRTKILGEWICAIDFITAEIEQNHTPIPDILNMLSKQDNSSLKPIFIEMLQRINMQHELSFGYHWHTTIRDLAFSLGMEYEEIETLRNTASYLGRYQAEMQISGLLHTRSKLVSIQTSAVQALENKGNVYRMCGIAAGIITVLMIV